MFSRRTTGNGGAEDTVCTEALKAQSQHLYSTPINSCVAVCVILIRIVR